MGDGVSAAGVADGLDSGNNVAYLAGEKRLHGDPFQLKNTDLFNTVDGLIGCENDVVPRFYLTVNDTQMNDRTPVGIVMRIKNESL